MSARIILSGFHSIEECLKRNPNRISKILIAPNLEARKTNPRIANIKQLADELGIRVENHPQATLEEPVLAVMKDYEYFDFDKMLEQLEEKIQVGERPIVLALDGITDAHNLGAILRTAAFMGVSGVVLPKDRSASITDAVYRIASGGVEYLQISQVTNLVSGLKQLKERGFWVVGFSEHANGSTDSLKCDFPVVLVIGNEEKGIRPLVAENCDHLLKFNPKGGLKSLNASVAAALAMDWSSRPQI